MTLSEDKLAKRRQTNKKIFKWVDIIVGAFFLLGILGAIFGGNDSTPADSSSDTVVTTPAPETPASSPTPKAAPTPRTPLGKLQAALGASDADQVKVSKDFSGPGNYRVRFKVKDNLTHGLIRGGIAMDTFDLAERAKKSGVDFKNLWFEGTFPTTDKYGKESPHSVVFRTRFSHATVQRIQYDNIDTTSLDAVESLADSMTFLLPDLRE